MYPSKLSTAWASGSDSWPLRGQPLPQGRQAGGRGEGRGLSTSRVPWGPEDRRWGSSGERLGGVRSSGTKVQKSREKTMVSRNLQRIPQLVVNQQGGWVSSVVPLSATHDARQGGVRQSLWRPAPQ